jgi:hypothetical protein
VAAALATAIDITRRQIRADRGLLDADRREQDLCRESGDSRPMPRSIALLLVAAVLPGDPGQPDDRLRTDGVDPDRHRLCDALPVTDAVRDPDASRRRHTDAA